MQFREYYLSESCHEKKTLFQLKPRNKATYTQQTRNNYATTMQHLRNSVLNTYATKHNTTQLNMHKLNNKSLIRYGALFVRAYMRAWLLCVFVRVFVRRIASCHARCVVVRAWFVCMFLRILRFSAFFCGFLCFSACVCVVHTCEFAIVLFCWGLVCRRLVASW